MVIAQLSIFYRSRYGLQGLGRWLSGLVLLPVLMVGCAKMAQPGGGPVDKTPPRILAHFPPKDATQVERRTQVEILFSEAMDRKRVEDALFIAPSVTYKTQWRGSRLRLLFPEDLERDRTYVVTVGTGGKDRRNNALAGAFTLAFATGERLNGGVLGGAVYRDHKVASTVHVWAYAGASGRPGIDPPQYQTQTDSKGLFEFSRLSAGAYVVSAFADGNRNGVWDEGEELALPTVQVEVNEDTAAIAGDLLLRSTGSPTVSLERIQALDRGRVMLYFTGEVEPDEVEIAFEGLAVEAVYGRADDRRKVYVATQPQEAKRQYVISNLTIGGRRLEAGLGWRGSGRVDAALPQAVGRQPADGVVGVGQVLGVEFDKPMRPDLPRGQLWRAEETVAGAWVWAGSMLLHFESAVWAPGQYRLELEGESLADLAGQAPADSALAWDFEVLAADALGNLAGKTVDSAGASVVAKVVLLGDNREYRTDSGADGFFSIDGLVPGKYIAYAFIDRDGDGKLGGGNPDPPLLAEPYCRWPELLQIDAGDAAEDLLLVFR
jgi:uncharacterized protein (DUF2141 family)